MSWLITGSEKNPTDPFRSQVSLLLHGDGTNGSTTITDSSPSPKTVTAVGNAQISTAQSKFGGASVSLDGSGDYLQAPTNPEFILGTGDFTLETWIYPLGFASGAGNNDFAPLFDFRTQAGVAQVNVLFTFFGSSTLCLFVNGSIRITGSPISTSSWTHVALSRSGGVTKLFVNGNQAGSNYSDTNNYVSPTLRLGANIGGDAFLNGYIDDLRITKGIARYTANFTPPTAPFPDI